MVLQPPGHVASRVSASNLITGTNGLLTASALIVDDEPPVARLIILLLKELGAVDVTVVPDGTSGLLAAETKAFDLAIVKSELRDMGGSTFIERMRALQANDETRTILTSILPPRSGLAADAFVQRPFDIDRFSEVAARLLVTPRQVPLQPPAGQSTQPRI